MSSAPQYRVTNQVPPPPEKKGKKKEKKSSALPGLSVFPHGEINAVHNIQSFFLLIFNAKVVSRRSTSSLINTNKLWRRMDHNIHGIVVSFAQEKESFIYGAHNISYIKLNKSVNTF